MHEYGIGLSEVRRWTFGEIFLFMRQIVARYERQNQRGKKKNMEMLTEDGIIGSEWEKG